MIIGVTGAAGFIGTAVTNYLGNAGIANAVGQLVISREHEPPRLELKERCGAVIHLAGKSGRLAAIESPASFYSQNTLGTLAVLEYCRQNDASLIFPSTYVYGPRRPDDTNRYVNERAEAFATNPYTQSKLISEELIRAYARDYKVDAWILRIFNVYGPGQQDSFIIPEIIRKLRGKGCELRSGSVQRDFIYVTDVSRALVMAALTRPEGCELVNIGSGRLHSLSEVASMLKSIMECNAPLIDSEAATTLDYSVYSADTTKAKERLGWSSNVMIAEGLQRTLRAFEEAE